jgi:hypothetical protein
LRQPLWEHVLIAHTLFVEPYFWTLFLGPIFGSHFWVPFVGPIFGSYFWVPFLGFIFGTHFRNPFLAPVSGMALAVDSGTHVGICRRIFGATPFVAPWIGADVQPLVSGDPRFRNYLLAIRVCRLAWSPPHPTFNLIQCYSRTYSND